MRRAPRPSARPGWLLRRDRPRYGAARRRPALRTWLASVALVGLPLGLLATPAAAAIDPNQPRIIDVVASTWTGATPTTTAQQVADTITNDTISRWKKISNGTINFTLGQTLQTPIVTRTQLPCSASGAMSYLNAVADAGFTQLGIADRTNHYMIVLSPAPRPDCIWDGYGVVNPVTAVGGLLILKDTASPEVIAHELGHNLGLGHSNLQRCGTGVADGPWTNCAAVEYGSATDLMSNNNVDSPLAAYHQWRLGIVDDADVAVGSRGGTFTLQPVSATSGTRALFMRDGGAAYWVEYRTADPTNGINAGLVIYRTDPAPDSSVESPIASPLGGGSDSPVDTGITTDVWMLNLGNYTYSVYGGKGSPSLATGATFATLNGGLTLSATAANGTASVKVTRVQGGSALPAPKLTAVSTWTTPTAELIAADYDDNGLGVARFDVQRTKDGASTVTTVTPTPSAEWKRTYLNPLTPTPNLHLADLPDGSYTLAIRAVDAAGVAGAWSTPLEVTVDTGRPTLRNRFTTTVTQPGIAATVRWPGATDAGSGVCRAQTVDVDEWSAFSWRVTSPGVPSFTLGANATLEETTRAYDCVGNGVEGTLKLETQYTAAKSLAVKGSWRSNGTQRVCVSNCALTVKADGTSTSLVLRQGTGTYTVAGRTKSIAKSSSTKARSVVLIEGAGTVQARFAAGTVVSGVQRVTGSFTKTKAVELSARPVDETLTDPVQAALADIGFSAKDFGDGRWVFPLDKGTTTEQPSIDLCEGTYDSEKLRVDRRQVIAFKQKDDPYAFVSTETVRYQSAAATAQAVRELDTVVAACKTAGGSVDATGKVNAYAFAPEPALPAGLRPAAERRVYLTTIGTGDEASTLLAVYQFRGEFMNALYVVKKGVQSLDTDTVRRWLNVATTLASRL